MDYKKYLVQPDAGLGNRLYCLYSALYYKQITGRDFDIIWLRENCCNAPFFELFDEKTLSIEQEVLTTWHLGYKNRYAIPTVISNIYMKYIKSKYTYYTAEATRDVFNELNESGIVELMNKNKVLCIKANGKYFDTNNFAKVRDSIIPAKCIRDMVDSTMGFSGDDNEPGQPTYGIHIRRTDNKASIANSPIEAFEEKIKALMAENPEARFYLATDDKNVENDFAKKYNLISHRTFGNTKSRDSIEGIKDAYVDMLCLSRCDRIFGSFGSSFSEMAALIGNVPLEIVTRK